MAVLLVIVRSAVFVFWEESQFDSDQAVMGLAAKHLSELRAFPLFFYGSNHILGVEAWMAAPVFALLGPSVTALKLPLLFINSAVALLLLRLLERDAGLRPAVALVPALFFIMPAPGTAAHFLDASGGNVEPFLYALLLWHWRMRPAASGLILGIGFLHREFTVYALIALLVIEARGRSLFTWASARRWTRMLGVAAIVWVAVQLLRNYASPAGPGTSMANLSDAQTNIGELSERFCIDLQTIPSALSGMLTEHWPTLFGMRPQPVLDFAIDSSGRQGVAFGWVLLAATAIVAFVGIARQLLTYPRWKPEYDACAYLLLVGALSSAGLVLARCGHVEVMRYDLLAILGAVGLSAWFLVCAFPAGLRRIWIVLVCSTCVVAGAASMQLLGDYLTHRHVGAKRLIARGLEARGVRYASSDYWLAYSLTFFTNERVIVASEDFVRIELYQREVEAHRGEAVRISRSECPGGTRVAGVYLCR